MNRQQNLVKEISKRVEETFNLSCRGVWGLKETRMYGESFVHTRSRY